MSAIKQIKVNDVVYDIKAKYDVDGNEFSNTYVKKDSSKVLSDENFTTTLKNKLDGIANNANNYIHPSNHVATIITEDETHRFVTDAEKNTWNSKISAGDIDTISVLTQTAYDELSLKDGSTLYLILEG